MSLYGRPMEVDEIVLDLVIAWKITIALNPTERNMAMEMRRAEVERNY